MESLRKSESSKAWGERKRILAGAAAEVLFALLPLVFVAMVLLHKDHSTALLASPEWSFGAAILFGQAVVKFMTGLVRRGASQSYVSNGPVALIVTTVIVLGLGPSLFTLTMILQAAEERADPGHWLKVLQITLFFGAVVAYMLLSTVGESLSNDERGEPRQ